MLFPEFGDKPEDFQTVASANVPNAREIPHMPNGDCVYLAPYGCSIYTKRPFMCRTFDCRGIALQKLKGTAFAGYYGGPVLEKGKELLKKTK